MGQGRGHFRVNIRLGLEVWVVVWWCGWWCKWLVWVEMWVVVDGEYVVWVTSSRIFDPYTANPVCGEG